MSKKEFLERLNELLQGISKEEREEAMEYYSSYFEDAGEKSDAVIIEELGSPEKVAEAVKADFSSSPTSYEGSASQEDSYNNGTWQNQGTSFNTASEQKKPWSNKTVKIVLLVILLIVAAPAIMSLLSAVLGLFVGFLALCLAFAVVAVVGVLIGAFILIKGLSLVAGATGVGLLLLGSGLLGIVIGIILFVAFIKFCIIVFPFLFRKIKQLFMWIRRKIGGY